MVCVSGGKALSGIFVRSSKNAPMNAVRIPQIIHTKLYGQIHKSGKKPASKTASGIQIMFELGGIAKLNPMLSTQSAHATKLAIFLRFDFAVLSIDWL